MRAANMKERPRFSLMKQSDVQNLYYMQMPRWLFSDPRYADMDLDAKVTYTFLLNRFQLSRRKGWVNDQGEVFVIFPRKALAAELRICEKRVTAAIRLLIARELIWEKRCGRGDANQIYLALVKPQDDPTYECAPFLSPNADQGDSRTADLEGLAGEEAPPCPQEPPFGRFQSSGNSRFRTSQTDTAEPPELRPSKIEQEKERWSQKETSPSVAADGGRDGLDDSEEALQDILEACELDTFSPETAKVFENAIERLFYSDSYRIGNATLPQSRVRMKLRLLDSMTLREAERKLAANVDLQIKNSTAYTMAVIFNCIAECESDLLLDPYLNSLRTLPKGGTAP